MAAELTHILFVLDRSGSMQSMAKAVIDGFNQLLVDQRKDPSPCVVSLVQFDNEYEEVFLDVPLAEVPALTPLVYFARGGTALFDALGRAVTGLGVRIDSLPAAKRPSKVIVVVHTDGQENASKEFRAEQVSALVKEHQEEGGWLFVFAGANIDAFAAGGHIGVSHGAIANYAGHAKGTEALYGATSRAVMRSRQMNSREYKSAVVGAARGVSLFSEVEVAAMAKGDVGLLHQAAKADSAKAASKKKSPR